MNQTKEAVSLARSNWEVQKEPADARILLECALAAEDVDSTNLTVEWLRKTRLEDVRLQLLTNEWRTRESKLTSGRAAAK